MLNISHVHSERCSVTQSSLAVECMHIIVVVVVVVVVLFNSCSGTKYYSILVVAAKTYSSLVGTHYLRAMALGYLTVECVHISSI